MTPHQEEQIVAAIEQAVKMNVTPTRSTRSCTCAVCEGEIAIGALVVELPVTSSTVCSSCFALFTISPAPRPME